MVEIHGGKPARWHGSIPPAFQGVGVRAIAQHRAATRRTGCCRRPVFSSALEQGCTRKLNYSPYTSTLNPDGNQYLLLQNQPNPFTAETAIGFVLPGACAAQLRVFDATGRLLWQRDGEYPAGYSVEKLRLDGLTASGVLFYELTTPFGTLTKRMVRVGN
ncbi:MAG: T9SS type A sorting domain-containing protein [Saprospiraceae bacterium]